MSLTKAQVEFLRQHRGGELARFNHVGRRTWSFVDRVEKLGLVEIIDPEKRFPWWWEGTRITPAGIAALTNGAAP